jgi:hypothetical protein
VYEGRVFQSKPLPTSAVMANDLLFLQDCFLETGAPRLERTRPHANTIQTRHDHDQAATACQRNKTHFRSSTLLCAFVFGLSLLLLLLLR